MIEAPPKVYTARNGSIDFVCPRCALSKSVNVERFLQGDKELRVKIRCKCHNLQSVLLERRSGRRKPTDIQGRYFFGPKDRVITDGDISIKDLSYTGLKFYLLCESNVFFGAGDVLRVQFKLFPNASFMIKRDAVIKKMKDFRVNAFFRESLKNEDDFLLKLFFYT